MGAKLLGRHVKPFASVQRHHFIATTEWTRQIPGFAYHRELQAWAFSGVPPAAVLKAATINGARALGVSDRLVRMVMKDGQLFDPQALIAASIGKIGPARGEASRRRR